MRPDKFTQKMQEALQGAQDVAAQFNQQEITNEHFLTAALLVRPEMVADHEQRREQEQPRDNHGDPFLRIS
jgi:ATP-dependent Clp protease ATP-binding subunit ClpA